MSVDEFGGDGPVPTWSVGELAAATGLDAGTLHHYDDIGLATPSLRTHAGNRRYTTADVRRLHLVSALRGFGFVPADIAGVLDGAHRADPDGGVPSGAGSAATVAPLDGREVVQRQLDQVHDRIARAERLRDRLSAVLELLDRAEEPPAPMLVSLMAEMTAVERGYAPDGLDDQRPTARRPGPARP